MLKYTNMTIITHTHTDFSQEVSALAQLRILVAYLGETSTPPWWLTRFTTPAGVEFSRFNFSNTYVAAAISGTTLAARAVHDDRIGRKGTRHLFRFDAAMERVIHREILEANQTVLAELIKDRESALKRLLELARQTVDAPEGPVQVGWLGEEEKEHALSDLAAHYLCGFLKGYLVLPYFAARR